MTEEQSWISATEWLTIPAVAEAIGETPSRVRRLLDDHHLIALRRDGVISIPSVFLLEGRPLASLRGTIIVLMDAGFTPEEVVEWLLSPEDTIGTPPIEALRAGRKSEVRRISQTLA
ncbi:Rv2175c family DNA-binding protein [Microbacterium sp. HA-8]|uniref:Rv2175c family DNA-binding protein n=1 Tax=unclassified Microbacterium TaxID=2609290 RepID=UPI0025E01C12|nr:Rv2175c family DNA-binding protein [Microbacterium sp.]